MTLLTMTATVENTTCILDVNEDQGEESRQILRAIKAIKESQSTETYKREFLYKKAIELLDSGLDYISARSVSDITGCKILKVERFLENHSSFKKSSIKTKKGESLFYKKRSFSFLWDFFNYFCYTSSLMFERK